MPKLAIFTEGQTEQVFVRSLSHHFIDNEYLGYTCLSLNNSTTSHHLRRYGSSEREVFLQIINVGNDESVISAVKERSEGLSNRGFSVLAIRDVYGQQYRSIANRCNAQVAVQRTIAKLKEQLAGASSADAVELFFAIMEIEAWFLGYPSTLGMLNPILTTEFIEAELGRPLQEIDPETAFVHPSSDLKKILGDVGYNYRKNLADAERLVAGFTANSLLEFAESGKCASFRTFLIGFLKAVGRDYLFSNLCVDQLLE